jgi:hypothetical protein
MPHSLGAARLLAESVVREHHWLQLRTDTETGADGAPSLARYEKQNFLSWERDAEEPEATSTGHRSLAYILRSLSSTSQSSGHGAAPHDLF